MGLHCQKVMFHHLRLTRWRRITTTKCAEAIVSGAQRSKMFLSVVRSALKGWRLSFVGQSTSKDARISKQTFTIGGVTFGEVT